MSDDEYPVFSDESELQSDANRRESPKVAQESGLYGESPPRTSLSLERGGERGWMSDTSDAERYIRSLLGETSSKDFHDEDASGYAGGLLEDILGGDLGRRTFASSIAGDLVPQPVARAEAAEGLCQLGKTADGLHHAYLRIKLNKKNVNELSVILTFKYVMYVDVSDNILTEWSLAALQDMDFLLEIRADNNRIQSCRLPPFPYLQHLSLNSNQINSTEGLEHPNLEVLELNDNGITEVKGLDPKILTHLKHIELRGNNLENTKGMDIQTLERLYLAENNITKIEGFENLKKLEVLHLRENPLTTLNGIEALQSLIYLNVRDCKLKTVNELKKLTNCLKLDTLIVWDNPFVKNLGMTYRLKTLNILPNLIRIDKSPVQEEELVHVDELMVGEEESIIDDLTDTDN